MLRKLTLVLAVGALAVAGCGGDDDDNDSGGAASTPAAESTPAAGGGTIEIHMKNFQFEPKSVATKAGTTIKWINDDTADHNVVAEAGEDFKSDNFGKGKSYEYTVDEPGEIAYVCTLHPGMDGTIIVR